jgi:hypothetical protein
MADGRFEPRNRCSTGLGIIELQVRHGKGVETFDPNSQIIHAICHPETIASWTPVQGLCSLLSGEPAILYRNDDLELPLTIDE